VTSRPHRRRAAIFLVVLVLPAVLLGIAAALTPMPPELRVRAAAGSILVDDRDGNLLREVRADDGSRARWIPVEKAGDAMLHAVLAAEDRRFYMHLGVDPVALARAAVLAIVHRRIVSGASTLTMQLARTVRPHRRSLWGKLSEMALAVRIECSLPKSAILEQYINRVSFGPNVRGVGSVSQAFFGKSPANLSAAEAALVAGMARGPSLYDLLRRPELARARRDRVLRRMARDGWLTDEELVRAKAEPVVTSSHRPSFGAPHLVGSLCSGDISREQPGLPEALRDVGALGRIRTTIDAELQRTAETQVAATVATLRAKGVTAASAVVVDNATGDVLAYVGSPDFFDEDNGGQNDGVRALRQPGSTLKPFVYELAMETLGFDPTTSLPDVDMHLDIGPLHDYAPHDYDSHVRGPVRLREALGNSLNIPAVWTAHAIGAAAMLDRLRELGFSSLRQDADYYGPALALGDGEVTLLELVRAYVSLAREGELVPLRFVSRAEGVDGRTIELEPGEARRVMPRVFADLIVDILKDHNAREASFGERTVLDFPFEVAAKTGTSKGFRDNWTVGFTSELTVAVWVGNFAGEPMTNVSGVSGAGPLFHAILEAAVAARGGVAAGRRLPIRAEAHEGIERVEVCALSGEVAGADCPHRLSEWRPRGSDASPCSMHERVRIDRQTGLRAGPGCGAADVVERVFERFPPDFAAWATATGRLVAPTDWSPRCPGVDVAASLGDAPRIAYPISGARFVVDPDTPRALQRLEVELVVPPSMHEVILQVDGREFARVHAPFHVSWPIEEGTHELVAVGPGKTSGAVVVHVRDEASRSLP
jgi:penicillin-binding protein 1C